MQASVETLGNLERRVTFSLPADRLESVVDGRLREIARGAKIKGFRPGKVPQKVIEQRFGQQVRAEALDALLREGFGNAVREHSLQIAGNPRIELREPTFDDTELAAIYRDSACTIVPSTFPEALGLTSLEAQASGVPVVVSNAGGLPETVDAGKSGLIFENGNSAELGEAVLSIVGNVDRRRAMGTAAREWVMKTFSWDVIATSLERTYHEAMAA